LEWKANQIVNAMLAPYALSRHARTIFSKAAKEKSSLTDS